jgi:hypothetical protein
MTGGFAVYDALEEPDLDPAQRAQPLARGIRAAPGGAGR